MSSVKIGLVQHACGAERQANVERALAGVREAAAGGAELICLPELFAAPYFCQVQDQDHFRWAEPVNGPTVSAVREVAQQLRVTVLAGFFEQRAPGIYHNSLVALGPTGEQLGLYRKMHIPEDPQFEEKFYFTPGDLGFMSIATPVCQVGPLICWDQWYPEAARLTAMQGAEVLFYPTAIGWLPEEKAAEGAAQLDAWRTIQRSHAVANGVYTVAVNRVGTELSPKGAIEFWGHSFVCGPDGVVLAEAGEGEQVLVVDCDLQRNAEVRQIWPFFRDRRIDAYGALTQRWGR